MDAIYLRYPDGQMTQRSEEEARRLWSEGLMPSGTIYWQEGMPDWKPVTQWLGERPVWPKNRSPDKSEAGISSYHFLLDPTRLTIFLQRLLWVSVMVACIALVDDVVEFVQVQFGQLTPDQVANNDPIQGIVGLLQSGLGIVTGITFLKWIYRAYKNIQGFGAEGLRFSPGWAVGYYFIPILSLIRPVQVMSEIWRASDDPRNWPRKTWFMAHCQLVDLVFDLHRGNPDLPGNRDPGFDKRPMDAGRSAGDPWRLVFDTALDCGAAAGNGGLSAAKGARGGTRSG